MIGTSYLWKSTVITTVVVHKIYYRYMCTIQQNAYNK